jgi:hypothetical protein
MLDWLSRRTWRFGDFLTKFMAGDRKWGYIRLLIVMVFISLFAYVSGLLWERPYVEMTIFGWNLVNEGLRQSPQVLLWLFAPIFTIQSARYMIIPLAAFVGAFFLGARYVQDIYELRSFRKALHYLFASLFGFPYPYLIISGGQKGIGPGEENLLDRIGGPGYVIIRPGNVVLFEHLNNPSRVLAQGYHFVPRFVTIKEIASLEDQHGFIDRLVATTKDGVVVAARDIHYRYRLWSSRRISDLSTRSQKVPYPYSVKAVYNMAYHRAARANGLTSWPDTVRIFFEGEIQNYIRRHTVDQVTAPRTLDNDPRGEIHQLYLLPRFREGFKNIGAQLLWCGIGHFEVENPLVNEQRVSTWQAGWRGDANVIRAYSEAVTQSYKEQGRAEAQAEILLSIVHALNDIGTDEAQRDQHLQDIFLFRIAQLLEAMNEEGLDRGGT